MRRPSHRRLALCCLLVAASAPPRPARAADDAPPPSTRPPVTLLGRPLRLDLTESLYLNYHLDPGDGDPTHANYGEIINKLNLQLAWWKLLFGLRLDSSFWVHTPQPADRTSGPSCPALGDPGYGTPSDSCLIHDGDPRLDSRFGNAPYTWGSQPARRFGTVPFDPKKFFEKLYLTYTSRAIDVTLGDFYVSFGRGLVLSIRKIDELGIDTTLLGGKIALHEGNLSAILAAGWTNIQNVDEATGYYTKDSYDFVAGGHVDYRIGGQVIVGAQAMGGLPSAQQSSVAGTRDSRARYGLSIDAPRFLPWLSLYGEYARLEDHLSGKDQSGDAIYAAATAYAGPTVWLLEFKDYRNFTPWYGSAPSSSPVSTTLVYQQAPTLERVITQINNNTDIVAARLRVDGRVNDRLMVFASFEVGQSHPTPDVSDLLYDAYLGAQLRWNQGRSHFFPLLGHRLERSRDDTGVSASNNQLEEQLFEVEWDFAQSLPRGFSIETSGLVWVRRKGVPDVNGQCDPNDPLKSAYCYWNEGNVYLSLKWAPRFILAGGYEFTTAEPEKLHTHDFFNGSFQWNITPGTSVRIFGGGQRPGLKCISGVCRVFPAFEGVKLEFVLRL